MVEEFIPNLSYMCKGIVFYTLNNKHSNYLYMMPRDSQIQIKSSSEIDDIVQDKYPDLWEKQQTVNNDSSFDSRNDNSDNSSFTNSMSNSINSKENENASSNISINIIHSQGSESVLESVIEYNNVVFKVLKTDIPDIYNLYCYDNSSTNTTNTNLIKHSIALIPNIKISHNLYYTFNSKPNNLGLNMECKYSQTFAKWIPIKFVDNTIFNKNIIEDIENKLKTKEDN